MRDKQPKIIPAERREKIERILQGRQFVSSSELCNLIDASESTVRRDLEQLEDQGILERVHGGAILTQHVNTESLYKHSRLKNENEKQRIAEQACSMIEENDVVFLNHGTTTSMIAQVLAKNNVFKNVTVISSNLGVMNALFESDINFICLGGTLRTKSLSLTGAMTIENLACFISNKCFIGVDGIDVRYGCTYFTVQDADVTKQMARNTHGQIHVVADHEKWGTVSPYSAVPFSRISSFITGVELNENISSVFEENGVSLLRV